MRQSPERLGREQAAREIIADIDNLANLDLIRLQWATRLGFLHLEKLVRMERLKRGEITIRDLTPTQRRELVDPERFDLHAIANGPIMQPDQIYLPGGKLSIAAAPSLGEPTHNPPQTTGEKCEAGFWARMAPERRRPAR